MEALFRNDLSLFVYTDGSMPDKEVALYEDKEDCGAYFNEFRRKGLFALAESEVLVETIVNRQYVDRFYLDKECTKEYEGNERRPELTLYVKEEME